MAPAEISTHEHYMTRALELARKGYGNVSPNPLVGCVIVRQDRIVGEGWHKHYGGPHAEVNAIENVKDKRILNECTLYVNLEPCSHTGKTPPCADLLIRHQVKKVVIANQDPNPLVAGNGIKKLSDAGVTVITDILSRKGHELNRRFFTYMEKGRPHIILKWAQTADGFIARENFDSKWISDEYSRQLVHKWRTEEDAVVVGSGTAYRDNPMLNVRNWSGRAPVRIVIDRYLKLGSHLNLFDGTQKTICYNLIEDKTQDNLLYVKLPEENMLEHLCRHLYEQRLQSVIVEGGGALLSSFITAGLWDEARVFISPKMFNSGIRAPEITGNLREQKKLCTDWLKIIERVPDRSSSSLG